MKKIAVLMGGISNEREISLKSGAAVERALRESGYDVTAVVLESESLETLPAGIEAVFIALHGGYGENGGVQADLDLLGIPYTGPGAAASRVAMDKVLTKQVFAQAEVPTPPFEVLCVGETLSKLRLPVVVKPPRGGSSVGISKVTRAQELEMAVLAACQTDDQGEALAESYIPGREWTVSVLNGVALPVLEIIAPEGWYGFTAKYTQGATRFSFPDSLEDQPVAAQAQCYALLAYQALECRGVSRVDFRVTPEGELFVLEVNTVPGLTATSLLPQAAARAGINFNHLCTKLIELAAHD
ncbi:MAG: D-alanine--D-alanine ligase [Kiritimatiellae bacterium]|nr:D-alanine--D-alanine ligase [Kiritimatiellia bacterium]